LLPAQLPAAKTHSNFARQVLTLNITTRNNINRTTTILCRKGMLFLMRSVTNSCIAGLGMLFAIGIAVSPGFGQVPPKTGTKTPTPPPRIQPNPPAQTGAQQRNQTNSSVQRTVTQKSQVNRRNLISAAEYEHMQKLSAELGMNESQFSQVVNIINESRLSEMAVNEDASLTPEQRQAKLLAIQRHQRSQIDSVLTPEQRTKLKEIEKRR
jgi:hypothetical protein